MSRFSTFTTAPCEWTEPAAFAANSAGAVGNKSTYLWNFIAAFLVSLVLLAAKLANPNMPSWSVTAIGFVVIAILGYVVAYISSAMPTFVGLNTRSISVVRFGLAFPHMHVDKRSWDLRNVQHISVADITLDGKTYKQLTLLNNGAVVGRLGARNEETIEAIRRFIVKHELGLTVASE